MAAQRPGLRGLTGSITARRLAWLLAGFGFLVIAVYGVYLSLTAATRQGSLTARRPNQAIVSGFLLNVTAVERDANDPNLPLASGLRLIKVHLAFENTSGSQQRADPTDFKLRSSGADSAPTFASTGDCRRWQRADLYPPHGDGGPLRDSDAQRTGAAFGPVTLCFLTPPSTGRLALLWSPDVGLVGGNVEIPLR